MKKNYFLITCLLMPYFSLGQFTIKGVVQDSITQVLLPGANVRMENSFLFTSANTKGKFILKNVKAEKIILRISFVGYKTIVKEVPVNDDVDLNILLVKDIVMADEVIVNATRASLKTGTAFKNLDKSEIEKRNFGQDIPFILAMTPSVAVTSDAGNGIGYTGIRIRGSDATRINVTINGIPINDAESQQLYWVDLPDIATSVDNIQVQRGVGTSTNGAGAFGGSINIQTNRLRNEPYLESNHALGSFSTVKNNLLFGTGLLNNHWTFDARLSKINSDGYVDRGTSDLKSIYISEGYYGKKSMIRLNIFSGKEITYQSWYGTPESRVNNDVTGMVDYTIRNGLDTEDSLNLLNSGRTYNFYTYKNQVDDYQQDNYQLHYSLEVTDRLTYHTSFHYTKGKGYYEEYKKNQDLLDYGISNSTITPVNLVRRKWLDNDFYGATYALQYDSHKKISVTLGGGWNQYAGDHFDEIISSQHFPLSEFPYRYEDNSAQKTDFNTFGKVIFDLTEKANLFADMQYRRVSYHFSGFDNELNYVLQKDILNFVNPKLGFTWKLNNEQSAYVSAGIGNKEPSRDDYVASSLLSRPAAENMQDFEGGYRLHKNNFVFAFNYYFMNYKNQLVLTGQVNDVGNYTRTNIPESYRRGIELELEWQPVKSVHVAANATFSQNKIKEYNQFTDDYDAGTQVIKKFKNTDIAFSPRIIAAGELCYEPLKDLTVSFITKYTDKQYLDNTSDETKKIKKYSVNDIRLNYKLKTKWVKEIIFGVMVNNIFNHLYESNGYTYNYIYGGKETVENFYYPQAGTNILGQVSLKF